MNTDTRIPVTPSTGRSVKAEHIRDNTAAEVAITSFLLSFAVAIMAVELSFFPSVVLKSAFHSFMPVDRRSD